MLLKPWAAVVNAGPATKIPASSKVRVVTGSLLWKMPRNRRGVLGKALTHPMAMLAEDALQLVVDLWGRLGISRRRVKMVPDVDIEPLSG
jgi:hypothetical protein